MREFESRGVQHQSRREHCDFVGRVEMVADNRMADCFEVDAQLMASASLGLEFHEACCATESLSRIPFKHAPLGNAWLAEFEVDDVNRAALRLLSKW